MKLSFKKVLPMALGVCMAAGSFGQSAFPDVNDTHWAADAIQRLKVANFIHGYTNGMFEGKRQVTRYEMASALYAIYAKGLCFNDEIVKKIKSLEELINNTKVNSGGPDYSADLAEIRRQMAAMRGWGDDINQVKRLMGNYQKELTSLGADLKKMRSDLDALSKSMGMPVAKGEAIKFSGDMNSLGFFGHKSDVSTTNMTQDGRTNQGGAQHAGVCPSVFLHELGLKIQNGDGSTIPFIGELVAGNMLSDGLQGLGNQSETQIHLPRTNGDWAMYLHKAVANVPGIGTIGRQGLKLNEYVLSRYDNSPFYSNSRWDDGKYMVDGIVIPIGGGGKWCSDCGGTCNCEAAESGLVAQDGDGAMMKRPNGGSIFVSRTATRLGPATGIVTPPGDDDGGSGSAVTTAGGVAQPINLFGLPIERMMGFNYNLGLGENGGLGLNFVNFDGNNAGFNRVQVYGADLNFDLAGMGLHAGAGKSVAKFNNTTVNDSDNMEMHADLTIPSLMGIKLGYRKVERFYGAPGDWGRVAVFRNLTDTQAFRVSLDDDGNGLAPTGGISLGGMMVGGFYEKGDGIIGAGDYTSYRVGITRGMTERWRMGLAYEETKFEGGFMGIANGATAKFTTLSLGYDIGANNILNLFYQLGDVNNVIINPTIGNRTKGGTFGFQLSSKF
jgi:hypothetical protein